MSAQNAWRWRCAACGFLASSLKPGAGTGVEGLASLRKKNFETLLERLERFLSLKGKTLLEPGCSTGLFLEAAARRGARVLGLEPEADKAARSRAKGFEVIPGFFPQALPAGRSFDVIVFNDVFEHLPDPVGALKVCAARMNPGGILAVNYPDCRGVLYRAAAALDRLGRHGPLERLWQKGFPSPHLSYFNRQTLARLVETSAPLRLIHTSRLAALDASGLRERVEASFQGAEAAAMLAGLRVFLPVQRAFPSDISLQFFQARA